MHYGGPELKSVTAAKLTGTDAGLREFVRADAIGGAWDQAAQRDQDAGIAALRAFEARQRKLDESNQPYRSVNDSGGRDFWAPEFGEDIVTFTLRRQEQMPHKWSDPTPRPGKAALDKARQVFDAFNTGDDAWAAAYKDAAGRELFGTDSWAQASANDIATLLSFGGFATQAPEPDSLEFRTEVEALKQAWAACDSDNPIDHYRLLTGPVLQAYTEWETEYTGQAEQRKLILAAEAGASKETRVATEAMMEAVRQAWLADQILYWQKYWAAHKDALDYPSKATFTKATADLNAAKAAAAKQVAVADAAAARAKTVADSATAAQQKAWEIADAAKQPRGRGLLYAQQSVQVAKASAAAAQAAAKATLTASNAAKATVADSQTLLALAKTQTHALNTQFRKAAALEAKAQAKAAAESAAKQAEEAAANAATAKQARATAEKAEQDAKAGAAEAKRQRAIAEAEKANAERERDNAARERQKAQDAEKRARGEQDKAAQARSAASTAGVTAAEKAAAAEDAERRAYDLRDDAVKAERERDATASRAAALEAAAAAAEGTEAAGETRAAATEARSAANAAAGAAKRARSAANEASTAAVNARAAATRAQGAATRSRAAADAAWSAYQKTSAAAATAHAAAAEAIDAAAAAKANAKKADADAKKAQTAAINGASRPPQRWRRRPRRRRGRRRPQGSPVPRPSTRRPPGTRPSPPRRRPTRRSASAPPYRETDSAAAFAVLVGQTSKTLAEQQAAAAKAKSDEAKKAAAQAKALADKAAGDAKIALRAAADAAMYAEKAQDSADAARASAAAAAIDAKAAKKADANAQKYDEQAGVDAVHAGFAANDAESAAAQADRDATDAERDAASARSAASSAESDASAADLIATHAESDATRAEKAAANAEGAAKDADAAATRAEEAQRKELEELRKQRAEKAPDLGADLSSDEEAALLRMCGQECVDQYRAARALAGQSLLDWVKANGGQILLDHIGWTDVKNCLTKGDVESCLWTLVTAVGLAIPVTKIPAVGKAIIKLATGVVGFFEKSAQAKRTLDKLRKLAEKAKKEPDLPPCAKKKSVKPAAFSSPASFVTASAAAASGDDEPDMCGLDPQKALSYEILDKIDEKYGPDVADGVEYQWQRMMGNSKEAGDHNIPGVGRDLTAMAEYFKKWRGKATHKDSDTGNGVAYDEDKGVIVIITARFIHGYKMSEADFLKPGRYVPNK